MNLSGKSGAVSATAVKSTDKNDKNNSDHASCDEIEETLKQKLAESAFDGSHDEKIKDTPKRKVLLEQKRKHVILIDTQDIQETDPSEPKRKQQLVCHTQDEVVVNTITDYNQTEPMIAGSVDLVFLREQHERIPSWFKTFMDSGREKDL